MALANLSIYYTWKNIKLEYNSIADIQDYVAFIIKKHESLTENLSVQIYPNKIKNRIGFKIKTGHKLELKRYKLGSTKNVADKNKDGGTLQN